MVGVTDLKAGTVKLVDDAVDRFVFITVIAIEQTPYCGLEVVVI